MHRSSKGFGLAGIFIAVGFMIASATASTQTVTLVSEQAVHSSSNSDNS